jgi:hypothetical protein
VVPRVAVTFEVPLLVVWVARIVKSARIVDVDVIAVAQVGIVTGIEIQVPSPTASAA